MSVLSRLRTQRAALAFIFVTAVLDIVAMGIIIPVLPVLIEDFCTDEDVLAELGLENPWDLSGLYSGTAEPHKTTGHVARDTDRIFLFRRPLLDEWCETGVDLRELVRHVLIHEIGHHFGFSDDDMDAIEQAG